MDGTPCAGLRAADAEISLDDAWRARLHSVVQSLFLPESHCRGSSDALQATAYVLESAIRLYDLNHVAFLIKIQMT